MTVPMQYAVKFKIPYVIYGETNDILEFINLKIVEYTNRSRIIFNEEGSIAKN